MGKMTKNSYNKWLETASHEEILKEYNKIRLILSMMKHSGQNSISPYPKKEQKMDNIKVIKYKYNQICQIITKRGYNIMKENYYKSNVRQPKIGIIKKKTYHSK